jgi:Na+/phosphate symporter
MASVVMLDLMGGVALLLWGLHMVRSGIIRAFGSDLRRALGIAVRNRFMALLAGPDRCAPEQHCDWINGNVFRGSGSY